MRPTLKDVDLYLKARAMVGGRGTPGETAAWQGRVDALVAVHPDIPEVAARVEVALGGEGPPAGGPFVEWLKKEVGAPPEQSSPWFERLARGVGAGMVAATRALDDEEADGAPLTPNQVDVRIQRLAGRDELVLRVRVQARTALRLRTVIARRLLAELEAFLAA